LRFEDARGSEEIYVHAQRDLTERIRNAHRTTVGGDQSLTVARDRAKVVEGEETRHIKGARHTHVGGSNTNLVVGSRTMQVGCAPDEEGGPAGLDELKVLGERSVYVQDRCFTEVGAAAGMTTSFEINPKEVIFRVPERFVVYVGDSKLEINRELLIGIARTCALQGSHGILQLADAAQLRSDNASIVAQGTAKLHLEQDRAVLDARRTLVAATQGNSGSSLALGADAQLEGAAVVLAETAVGESGCRIAEDGVTTTGVAITAEAKGVHTLKGATIDMN
jgi:type VI secretion system secreted protein VgrG